MKNVVDKAGRAGRHIMVCERAPPSATTTSSPHASLAIMPRRLPVVMDATHSVQRRRAGHSSAGNANSSRCSRGRRWPGVPACHETPGSAKRLRRPQCLASARMRELLETLKAIDES